MADYQKTVDDIQEVLYSETETEVSAFNDLVEQYNEAVKETNRRLRTCDGLLLKGHRSEAIQQSEAEPNLMEVVSILDFPGREQWAEFVEQSGMTRPQNLLSDVAADLNEAYAAEQPLAHLMRHHRLHALARSPLPTRINILRKIASHDPDSPIWEDDIRLFEKNRHNQLHSEVEAAAKEDDVHTLAQLEQEIRSSAWLERPPTTLVDRTIELHTQLRAGHARVDLEKIEKELTQAFSNFDVELGRELRARWNARAAIGVLKADDPLLELVAPSLEWLEEQDEQEQAQADYDATIAQLEQALDEGGDRGELDRLYHAAARTEWGVPELLERRLAERLQYLEVAGRRRGRLMLVGVVMVVLLIAVATAFGIYHQTRAGNVAALAASIEQLRKEGKLTGARQILDDIKANSSDLFNDPPIQKQLALLQADVAKEEGRKELRRQHIARAQMWFSKPHFGTDRNAKKELTIATELSRTDAENAEIAQVELDIETKVQQMQQEVDDSFQAEYGKVFQRFKNLGSDDLAAMETLLADANKVEARLHVSTNLKRPLKDVITKIETKHGALMERLSQERFLEQITVSVGNRTTYCRLLKEYAERFPEMSQALGFQQVAEKEEDPWKGLEEWNRLIETWEKRDLGHLKPEEAADLVSKADAMLQKHAGFPAAAKLKELKEFLVAMTQRVDEDGEIHLRLNEMLNSPTVIDFRMVQTKNGKRYYFEKNPVYIEGAGTWSFYHVVDFELTDTKRLKVEESDIANPETKDGFDWTAPQAAFSTFATEQLAGLDHTNWEGTFYKILERLQEDQRMEPILKLQLMTEILDVACRGSLCLAKAYGKDTSQLERAMVDISANWITPDDPAGRKAREAAQRLLARLEDPKAAGKRAKDHLDSLKHPWVGTHYVWVGWLCRDDGGQWMVSCPTGMEFVQEKVLVEEGIPKSGMMNSLFVLIPPSGDDPLKMEVIGKFGGKPVVSSESAAALVEGRPVFFPARIRVVPSSR